MNDQNAQLLSTFVPSTYIQLGLDAIHNREKLFTEILSQRRLPRTGWDEMSIHMLLHTLAAMDSNNFRKNVGAGEREARIFSPLVANRHFHLCHGIGRSGDIAAVQPKATGSSIIAQLANLLAKDILKEAGMVAIKKAIILPVATGMSISLTMMALKLQKPSAKFVIWPRIDQKSCFKAILIAGLTPLVLPNILVGDELCTDLRGMKDLVITHGQDSILCVLSTTSCFAPRGYDLVEEIAIFCAKKGIGHVINNAYGVQSSKCTHVIEQAMRKGRVDAIIQSLDKNFLMPVGGAIVCSASEYCIENLSKLYPGRASNGPCLDFFITVLQMGSDGFKKLIRERKNLAKYFRGQLEYLADKLGERVLSVSRNEVSFAMTINSLSLLAKGKEQHITYLGAMLFSRGVSGARVITGLSNKTIEGYVFRGYGSSHDMYNCAYITFACAIGMEKEEVDILIARVITTINEWKEQIATSVF